MWIAALLNDNKLEKQNLALTHISLDSRDIGVGGVFFALAGSQQHGLIYASQVVSQGAVAIVYDPAKEGAELAKQSFGVPVFAIPQLAEKLGEIAARFYARPTEQLNIIGITGTNGKTSCSQFLAQVMDSCGVIGTLGWGRYTELQHTKNTTPDAFQLHKILADFVKCGISHVAMEVSSHGLEQGRVNALNFKGVIFTNMSHDHLDYHGNMETYFQTKLRLVQWQGLEFVVINLDDAYAARIIAAVSDDVRILTYSLLNKEYAGGAGIKATNINYSLIGISCDLSWQGQQGFLKVSLLGEFNLQNILAVVVVLLQQGVTLKECLVAIQSIRSVPGRMECFTGRMGKPMVVVDYAHTPDALGKVLNTLRQHCNAKLSVVFGCGGDRDKSKRRKMGFIATQLADQVIVTDDNPRYETPDAIINDVIAELNMQQVSVVRDRKQAIAQGIASSSEFDIVLVAGKGHEEYQDIKGVYYPFSDRLIVQELLVA